MAMPPKDLFHKVRSTKTLTLISIGNTESDKVEERKEGRNADKNFQLMVGDDKYELAKQAEIEEEEYDSDSD